ncbi:ribosome biogenesis protein Sqt1 [Russula emetica]|nr:ribosome biogenesis protein Sqt1 [Russula emetica]
MATTDQPAHEEGQDEEYIEQDDIYAEIDEGDEPMDDEDDEAGGVEEDQGEVVWEDNSIQLFSGHEGPVYTVSAHPIAPLAVSGGGDDAGYIWNVTDGEIVVKLTGHTDSVSVAAFSSDGEMVSTGGMDGKVRVWRRVGKENYKTWEFLTELQGPDEVIWLRWHPKGPVLLAGSNDSTVWLWQLPSGNTMQVFAGHTGPVQCGDFTPDGKRIVTACADNTLIYWDPRSPTPLFKLTGNDARFDLGGITSLAINPASTIAVVGGAEGGVRVISLSKGEVISALGGHTEGESVEAVAFVNIVAAVDGTNAPVGSTSTNNTVVTGATDGKVCIWDLNTSRLRTTLEHKDAVTSLLVHPTKSHLVISSSADHTLRTWDVRAGSLVREHKGHQEPINGAALGNGGEIVVSASDDGTCLAFGTE